MVVEAANMPVEAMYHLEHSMGQIGHSSEEASPDLRLSFHRCSLMTVFTVYHFRFTVNEWTPVKYLDFVQLPNIYLDIFFAIFTWKCHLLFWSCEKCHILSGKLRFMLWYMFGASMTLKTMRNKSPSRILLWRLEQLFCYLSNIYARPGDNLPYYPAYRRMGLYANLCAFLFLNWFTYRHMRLYGNLGALCLYVNSLILKLFTYKHMRLYVTPRTELCKTAIDRPFSP